MSQAGRQRITGWRLAAAFYASFALADLVVFSGALAGLTDSHHELHLESVADLLEFLLQTPVWWVWSWGWLPTIAGLTAMTVWRASGPRYYGAAIALCMPNVLADLVGFGPLGETFAITAVVFPVMCLLLNRRRGRSGTRQPD